MRPDINNLNHVICLIVVGLLLSSLGIVLQFIRGESALIVSIIMMSIGFIWMWLGFARIIWLISRKDYQLIDV